jgi:hypothetical protein
MSKLDFLYELLPTIYRQTDIPRDMPLRALFAILQEQHDLIESNIATLYDNWFVETCEPWALPYLADLPGADRIRHDIRGIDSRRLIANTIAYRRRKGIVATIEHVVEDATGWSARIVEGIDLVAVTEAGRRRRSRARGTVSTRDIAALDLLGGPFDGTSRTAQVRADGLSNLDRVGIFLWRLQSYPMRSVEAGTAGGGHGRFTFDPLGRDMPLFNRRLGSGGISRRNGMRNVSAPLSRRLLADELGRHGASRPTEDGFLSGTAPAFALHLVGSTTPAHGETLPPCKIAISDLGHWQQPPASKNARVAVDPERGRLMLLREEDRRSRIRILTDHCYGLAGDVGGGPYFQPATPFATGAPAWRARVGRCRIDAGGQRGQTSDTGDIGAPEIKSFTSLGEALCAWAQTHEDGIIEIADSGTYRLDHSDRDGHFQNIRLEGNRRSLTIQAAPNQRPCIVGTFVIDATAANAKVTLDGLLIGGAVHTSAAMRLTLRHCTVTPAHGHVSLLADRDRSDGLRVVLESTVTAALRLPANARELKITDSIIDGGDLPAIAASGDGDEGNKNDRGNDHGPPVIAERTTFIGAVLVAEIRASDSIFAAALAVTNRDQGFVRYCSIAPGSRTPRRYECQSDASNPGDSGAGDTPLLPCIRPRFVSLRFGHPGYAQLAASCPREILAGASNGAEMGAFNVIDDARRQDNLRDILDEHLPIGYRPVTIYVT